jgi:hypothetical protein
VLLWEWHPAGYLTGFSGWCVAPRFIATLVLALSVCAVVRASRSVLSVGLGYLGIGLAWGLLSYAAQEGFFGGLITLGILTSLLFLTGTFDPSRLRAAFAGFAGGAASFYIPVCTYYLTRGGLAEFWRNYFLVPARFSRGYANTPWSNPLGTERLGVAYYTLPYLVILLTLLAIYRTRPLRVAGELRGDRLLIVASSVAFLAAFSSSLLRADYYHLVGAMFAVPVIVATAVFHLPSFHFHDTWRRWTMRLLILMIVAALFLPIWKRAQQRVGTSTRGRMASYSASIPAQAGDFGLDEIERRYGASLSRSADVRSRIEFMRKLKSIVGNGRTLVMIREPDRNNDRPRFVEYPGEIYFCADLNPGPIWLERSDLVGNEAQRARFQEHLAANLTQFDYLVSDVLDEREVEIFTKASPESPRWEIRGSVRDRSGRTHVASIHVFGRPR